VPADRVAAEEKRLFEEIPSWQGKEDPYALRRELRAMMQKHMGVFRTGELMEEGLRKLDGYKRRFADIHVKDKTRYYNTNLFHVLELENLLELAEVMLKSGLARQESRGGHSRRDFTERDDANWLKHTLAWKRTGGLELDYKPVTITKWKPVERKY
jgi:succinate dehydrogenase / fumarate reductase flavoprotein subunit